MLRSNKTRIVKLEQARGARARRYVFYFDEVAEAKALEATDFAERLTKLERMTNR
jgi:hypothetical protein